MKKNRIFLFLLFTLGPLLSFAQSLQDTIGEIHINVQRFQDSVEDLRIRFTAGQQSTPIDSVYRALYNTQSLVNLLAQQTPAFLKSYGLNGMATLSLRGASAAQSSVLWNGVPILNPALGVADISLLNTGLFDQISLQYGSSAALFGSGNVGGMLALDQAPVNFSPGKHAALTLGGGNYGRLDGALKTSWQNRRFHVALHTFYQYAKNDFPYTDYDHQRKRMPHALLEAGGALFAVTANLGKTKWSSERNHTLSLRLWWQQYDREIPPALFEYSSQRRQKDGSIRSLISWQRTSGRHVFYAKSSWNREALHYEDRVVPIHNDNVMQQYYQELGWKVSIRPGGHSSGKEWGGVHSLLLFSPLQYTTASGANIEETQFRPAIVATYSFKTNNDKLRWNIAVRQEWVDEKTAPLLPGAGIAYQLISYSNSRSDHYTLQLRTNMQRTYRIPNLNELYYFPGGNKELKPEQGWNTDGGYSFRYWQSMESGDLAPRVRKRFSHELSIFNRHIKDWIYWIGGSIWTPHNIAEVYSRGLETDNKLTYAVGRKLDFHLSFRTAYVLATTASSYLPGDGSKGKQLPYTPRYNAQGNVGLNYLSLFLNYNHTYTGYRFTTIDESAYLSPYQTGNVQLMYLADLKRYTMRISVQVQNIWNESYQVVNARPMPGRYLLLSLQLGWRSGSE